jgi:hypothetical protein
MADQAWRPSRFATVLISVLTVWPLIYLCLFIGFMTYSFTAAHSTANQDTAVPALFAYVFVLHLLTMLLIFVLMTIYIVHVFRTDLIPNDKKVLWVVVIFFGSFIAMPIYWYLYMWRPLGAGAEH